MKVISVFVLLALASSSVYAAPTPAAAASESLGQLNAPVTSHAHAEEGHHHPISSNSDSTDSLGHDDDAVKLNGATGNDFWSFADFTK